ncbi:hypothetical protein PHYBLDRAFT_141905 [Phycomyces blakesleeanus NRRL 1555(-)]|uniref:Uncharacterized protein n=1 Tax=Phycomyces blakesleeanus (strain ATCC 8743b / DSM 1359 / FGSC 10004 / NBRC 33097 / NRRL 1555) TaxID=763407 RepID=A0A162UU88_PHYB8|nr:hypothetical protein PHYBLDRAFT_141905 [Phycomyces blakesleeanus NRRL 1555(-)]OAD78042.1 hypothetical protein PHYBLDRAFT_141905 [Phycomyces blakesleeanus NRRL 1555(-)]|eukprot:XP_018296082.1 hypothetical protein PHYBLDRAFT_141905 [Phycomyces blakesleeanus NRRL 1555(-)]
MNSPADLTPIPEKATLSPMSADELFSDLSEPIFFPDAASGFGFISGSDSPSIGREVATASRSEHTRLAVTNLEKCSVMLASPNTNTERADREEELTLSRRDLPKFQLASSTIKPFSNEEKNFLPLCLSYTDDGWVEMDFKKCIDGKAAKSCFNKRHGSSLVSRQFTNQVFTMMMKNTESIGDYLKKFPCAVYNAGLPKDNAYIANRFLALLILSVQTLVRVIMAHSGYNGESKRDWTVEQVTQISRYILADNNRVYSKTTQLILSSCGQPEKNNEEHSRKKLHHSNKITKHKKILFCSHHEKNPTHDKNNEPILMVSQSSAKDKFEQTLKTIQNRIDEDMEEISLECKYLLDRVEKN